MAKQEYLSEWQIIEAKEHLKNIFQDEYHKTLKELKESKKFNDLKEEYLSTKSYEKLLNSFGGEDTPEIIANVVEKFVTDLYDPSKGSIDSFIRHLLCDSLWGYKNKFNLWNTTNIIYNDKEEFTLDNYKEKVIDIVDQQIDKTIEEEQEKYATRKMNIHEYIGREAWENLEALIAINKASTLEELEEVVKNNLNYEDLILKKYKSTQYGPSVNDCCNDCCKDC